jgi:hypothetical protein
MKELGGLWVGQAAGRALGGVRGGRPIAKKGGFRIASRLRV